MGMIQAGNDFGFALEALAARRIVREMVRKNLDGDRAVETRVPSPIHFSHATCANGRKDFVRAKFEAVEQRHGWADYKLSAGRAAAN